MPVAAISAASSLATTGLGLAQSIGAGKRTKMYENLIENYDRQKLLNPYDGLQVSTAGADLQREDLARSMATFSNVASLGGSRAIASFLPNALQQQIAQEEKIAANLDQQFIQNENMRAQGNDLVQKMQENRETNDLLGLGQALQTSRQERANGINMIGKGLMSAGMLGASGTFDGDKTVQVDGDKTVQVDGTGINDNFINGKYGRNIVNSVFPKYNLLPLQLPKF